jgi:hypothetical protein
MVDRYSINKTQAWVNKKQFPIEGETKTYQEIKKSLGWKGGDYEDYENKKEAEKAWNAWDKWHEKHRYKYWSWGYYQWNNITFDCLRCGLEVKNGAGYRGFETVDEFEKEREEEAQEYPHNYKSKDEVPYYLYCEVDADLKGYNGAYVKGNIRAYWFFKDGWKGGCASSNSCLGNKKTREFILSRPENKEEADYVKSLGDNPKCLTDIAWEQWLKEVKRQGKELVANSKNSFGSKLSEDDMRMLMFGGKKVNYSEAVLNYRKYKEWFDEWVRDKDDICKKADELRWKRYRDEKEMPSKEAKSLQNF